MRQEEYVPPSQLVRHAGISRILMQVIACPLDLCAMRESVVYLSWTCCGRYRDGSVRRADLSLAHALGRALVRVPPVRRPHLHTLADRDPLVAIRAKSIVCVGLAAPAQLTGWVKLSTGMTCDAVCVMQVIPTDAKFSRGLKLLDRLRSSGLTVAQHWQKLAKHLPVCGVLEPVPRSAEAAPAFS